MSRPTVHWRTTWDNGAPTHVVTLSATSDRLSLEVEQEADNAGIVRDGHRWRVSDGSKLIGLFARLRALGCELDFGPSDENAAFDLQRLMLNPETRNRLEMLTSFELKNLAGYCPVQAEGLVDGEYFYFRARGSHWRIELGGNENGTKSANWWYEEYWPNESSFGAGYMSDEETIRCIIGSVEKYRTEDRGRFDEGHPDYERTMLEGWSMGAISLHRVVLRLGISGQEALDKVKSLGIDVPWFADLELKALHKAPETFPERDDSTGTWVRLPDEDE